MSISYQFGDVDAHGALIRSQAASLEAEHIGRPAPTETLRQSMRT